MINKERESNLHAEFSGLGAESIRRKLRPNIQGAQGRDPDNRGIAQGTCRRQWIWDGDPSRVLRQLRKLHSWIRRELLLAFFGLLFVEGNTILDADLFLFLSPGRGEGQVPVYRGWIVGWSWGPPAKGRVLLQGEGEVDAWNSPYVFTLPNRMSL